MCVRTRACECPANSSANTITVSSAAETSDTTTGAAAFAKPAAANLAVTGTRSVLVMLVHWTAPDSVTQASAANQIGTIDSDWFSSVSHGQLRLTATATPWMAVSPTDICTDAAQYDLLAKAETAALANGYNPAAYDHEMIYFPNANCLWAGMGMMPGRVTWISGWLTTGVTVHELGHNLGLPHSHSLTCTETGTPVVLGSSCTETEYGDLFDVMGSADGGGSFNAAQQETLGWIAGRVQTLSAPATLTVAPLENATGTAAVKVVTPSRTYWVEHRRAVGVDAFLGGYPGATDGVLVHIGGQVNGTDLLDGRPGTQGGFADAAIPAGSTWTSPDGLVLRVNSSSTAGVSISVSGPWTTPSVPRDLTAYAGNASATVTWSSPASDGHSSITGYVITATPGGARQVVDEPTRNVRFNGLVNGTNYSFAVFARNAVGDGPAATSKSVVPAAVPGPPTNVTATGADTSATVLWSPPSDVGGAPIDGYAIDVSPEGRTVNVAAGATSTMIPGLTNGTQYTFTVRAHNNIGFGPPSPPSTAVTPTAPTAPTIGVLPGLATRTGYWMLSAAGDVYSFGNAQYLGGTAGVTGQLPFGITATHLEPTPSGDGYWIVDGLGRVYAFGDARWFGNANVPTLTAGELITSQSATSTGNGYWLFTNRGRVLPFGDATFHGDMANTRLNGPVLGSVSTATGRGYYMVAADGGIFAFGDATFFGSMGAQRLNAPVQSLVPTSSGNGYWLVASDGGIFAFGDAKFRGSMGATKLNRPVVGMVRFGTGYLMVGADGGIFNFGDKPFLGSLGDRPPIVPIVSAAALGT